VPTGNVEVSGKHAAKTKTNKENIMPTKSIVGLFTAGALIIGLGLGGVATAAFAGDFTHAKAHHSVVPAVPVTPANDVIPSHRIQVIVAPSDVFNLVKARYDKTLYPSARYEAVPGTYTGDIEQAGGQSEQYIGRDGNVITIGVAKGNFASIERTIARSATSIGGYGANVKVYEINGGGTYSGDYEVFAGGYWFSLTSNLFTSPQAAAPIIQAALQTIPQG
jgi:hypothetical protein